MSSGTATLDFRPTKDNLEINLEYRHDQADTDIYFRGAVQGDGSAGQPYLPNAHSQDTMTLGLSGWF